MNEVPNCVKLSKILLTIPVYWCNLLSARVKDNSLKDDIIRERLGLLDGSVNGYFDRG